jgi:hypothetical protein
MTAGRPSLYSQELIDTICERIACGESLRSICLDDDMPHISNVIRWLAKPENEIFRVQYAHAREVQADTLVDEIIYISDHPQEGTKTKETITGIEITRGDMIEHRRLQVDARKWFASKVAPKKYGERLVHQGDSDADPIKQKVELDASARITEIVDYLAGAKAASNTQEIGLDKVGPTETTST